MKTSASHEKKRYLSVKERSVYHRLEDVIGCKWSAGVVAALADGIRRPGELQRYIPGLSKKVLNERLRKLHDFGLIDREEFRSERLPHVEYRLTTPGRKLARILGQIRALDQEM